MVLWERFSAKMPILALIFVVLFWILIGLAVVKLIDQFINDF